MKTPLFPERSRSSLLSDRRVEQDPETLDVVRRILCDIRERPERIEEYAKKLDGLCPGDPLMIPRESLEADYRDLDEEIRAVIDRAHDRIYDFAFAQRECLRDLETEIEGGRAGHRFVPHLVAGCYAPGGRFSLPSSVLMTVIPARVAGVREVIVASPKPGPVLRAAAYRAGADCLLALGGAQAIGAMAYGLQPSKKCDVIVGPGNRYVTAAKHLVRDCVSIDMLAGPSELLILADGSSDPDLIACDLLAQAEHDADAWPVLVSTDRSLVESVQRRLELRLQELSTKDIAQAALARGGYALVSSIEDMIELSESIAPEHLQVMTSEAESLGRRLTRFGSLFLGQASAEVLADYGAGPNHVLPTGGTAGVRGGLSVMDFMSLRTWMRLDAQNSKYRALVKDSEQLAELEGLSAHALSARVRS